MQNRPRHISREKIVQSSEINSSEQQEIINNILFIGMEDIPLGEKLHRSLKNIITTSWINEDVELGIFVVISDTNTIVLKAQHN
ncbi:MAG TPA: hypothetical protein ENJ87_06435, partial [Gammaproteobacteria bacterium]|nr:hypothetical protein [Gammaproteobacteria bacterium]